MSSTKKIVGQLKHLRELITSSPSREITRSKRILSTRTESVHTSHTHHHAQDSESRHLERKSRSEREESKSHTSSRHTEKASKSTTKKSSERKPIPKATEVPPSIRESKFRFRSEQPKPVQPEPRYRDTFVDAVPNLKTKKSSPKQILDHDIHKFTSKLVHRHQQSSDSDEFYLQPCKQAIQSRAVIRKRVLSSSSEDEIAPPTKAYDFLDESSSSDSEFKRRMKRVSALTRATTSHKKSRVIEDSSDTEVSRSSDSEDLKMPVPQRKSGHIRPNIQRILDSIDVSDYSDDDFKLITPPKKSSKKVKPKPSSSSDDSEIVKRTTKRPTKLQISVPVCVSTRFDRSSADVKSGIDVSSESTGASKDVRAEILKKYGVFASSSDESDESPKLSRDEIKSKLAQFGIESSDSESYSGSETISQKLLSKHRYAAQLVDMKEEPSSETKRELKGKMKELGVTDSSSSDGLPLKTAPKQEASGVDRNFLRKYGISDSSSEEEDSVKLVHPAVLAREREANGKADVDESLLRDQRHILAAYGVSDSSSDENENSSKLLAGSLRERLAKMDMSDDEQEEQNNTRKNASLSGSEVFSAIQPKPEPQQPQEPRKFTSIVEDATPEEIVSKPLSESTSEDEEEELNVMRSVSSSKAVEKRDAVITEKEELKVMSSVSSEKAVEKSAAPITEEEEVPKTESDESEKPQAPEEEDILEPVIMIDEELVQSGPQIRLPTPLPSTGQLKSLAEGFSSSDSEEVKKPAVVRPIPKIPPKVAPELDASASKSKASGSSDFSDDDLKVQIQNVKAALLDAQDYSLEEEQDDKAALTVQSNDQDVHSLDEEEEKHVEEHHEPVVEEEDSDTSLGLTAEEILKKYSISLNDDSGSGDEIDMEDVDRRTQEILSRFNGSGDSD